MFYFLIVCGDGLPSFSYLMPHLSLETIDTMTGLVPPSLTENPLKDQHSSLCFSLNKFCLIYPSQLSVDGKRRK